MAEFEEARTMSIQNELMRAYFMQSFTPGSTLTKDQQFEYTPNQIACIEDLARELMWSSIERRGAVSAGGTLVEEIYLQLEDNMPSSEMFDTERATQAELEAIQSSIWACVTRRVADEGLTNGVEIMKVYDEAVKPYFGMTWLQANSLKSSTANAIEIREVD